MKKVLIVTPNWPPISCPDLHRVRMALPYFAEFGWEPLILKIDPAEQEGIKDPDLCRTVPDSVRTWQAGCLPLAVLRCLGVRNVGLRSFFHLARLGDRIIREEKPSAAFFSTTMFPVMTLGRYWLRRHGLPYVLDFQDPWMREEQGARSEEQRARSKAQGAESANLRPPTSDVRPPASDLSSPISYLRSSMSKRRFSDLLAARLEPFAMRRVSHVVSVSPAYVSTLHARYSRLRDNDFTVLPFGAAETDYAHLRGNPVRQTRFNPKDGKSHWVYVGRGGLDMAFSLRSLFKALKQSVESRPALRRELRLHFIGTAYAPKDRAKATVEPLAREAGLEDVVTEITDRIPYFEALQCLLDADALIMPGSDDPGYTASKIYPYILARKPLLALFHQESSIVGILQKTKAGTVVPFSSGETPEVVAERILAAGWLPFLQPDHGPQTTDHRSAALPALCSQVPAIDWSEFEPYTAREMTRRICAVFDRAVGEKLENRS